MKIKVAIADDHPMMIQGLKHTLQHHDHIQLMETYFNGNELMLGLQKTMCDVLLLDIQMPGQTGDQLTPQLLKKYPDLKILVLTNFDSTLYASNMFRQGVHGYLLKTADEQTLVQAIETVFNGGTFIEENMKQRIEQSAERIENAVSLKSSLTPREKEILPLLVNGDTTQQIADKLFLSHGTVENYRFNILKKLDVKNSVELVKKALQLGLVE